MTLAQACQRGRALLRQSWVGSGIESSMAKGRADEVTLTVVSATALSRPDMVYLGPLLCSLDEEAWADGWMKLMLATAPVKGSA